MTSRTSLPEQNQSLAVELQRGCSVIDHEVTAHQQGLLLRYLDLLGRWNKAYNLTAVRDASQMVSRHLLDSLVIAPFVDGQRCLDVGTGAGLPGVPMAILYPQREVHLLDSNGKKTRFLFQVKTDLCLDNMVVHQARVESFQAADPYDVIMSRAFASLQDMVKGCRHLLAPKGRFLAMKGACPDEEIEAVKEQGASVEVYPLKVPGLTEQRHMVELTFHRAPS